MEKTLLIAGKDFTDGTDFASNISQHGRTTLVTTSTKEAQNGANYRPVYWNRTSAISARTVILSCVNATGHLDEVVFIFDEAQYAAQFIKTASYEIESTLDEMILGYQYLTQELIARFSQRKDIGKEARFAKLVYLYKQNITMVDTATGAARAGTNTVSSPFVAAAGAAFKAFAENTAATLTDSDIMLPILITCDQNNDLYRRENALATWLCEHLNSLDEAKKRPSAKQLCSWLKAGAKKTSFFSF